MATIIVSLQFIHCSSINSLIYNNTLTLTLTLASSIIISCSYSSIPISMCHMVPSMACCVVLLIVGSRSTYKGYNGKCNVEFCT